MRIDTVFNRPHDTHGVETRVHFYTSSRINPDLAGDACLCLVGALVMRRDNPAEANKLVRAAFDMASQALTDRTPWLRMACAYFDVGGRTNTEAGDNCIAMAADMRDGDRRAIGNPPHSDWTEEDQAILNRRNYSVASVNTLNL